MSTHAAICGVLATLVAGCVVDDVEMTTAARPIINSTPITDDRDPEVVALTVAEGQFCSGTLISPTVVLTAAHCLPPYSVVASSIDDIGVFIGPVVGGEGITVRPVAIEFFYEYAGRTPDLGILELADSPFVLASKPMASRLTLREGAKVRLVGYGVDDLSEPIHGVKREGTAEVEVIEQATVRLSPGPGLPCNGDSGGPGFSLQSGREVLAVVHSTSSCDSRALSERVDVAYDTIVDYLEMHSCLATTETDGQCTANCGQPDPDCPCADDGLCDSMCTDSASDPDCATECDVLDGLCATDCAADGVCNPMCPADLDCDPKADVPGNEVPTPSGGCSMAGVRDSFCGALWLFVVLVFRRRSSKIRESRV